MVRPGAVFSLHLTAISASAVRFCAPADAGPAPALMRGHPGQDPAGGAPHPHLSAGASACNRRAAAYEAAGAVLPPRAPWQAHELGCGEELCEWGARRRPFRFAIESVAVGFICCGAAQWAFCPERLPPTTSHHMIVICGSRFGHIIRKCIIDSVLTSRLLYRTP